MGAWLLLEKLFQNPKRQIFLYLVRLGQYGLRLNILVGAKAKTMSPSGLCKADKHSTRRR